MTNSELGRIRSTANARERARLAHAHILDLQTEAAEASKVRREAVSEAINGHGATRIQMAELLGVSRERIRQILAEGPPPERALLAPEPGPVTIAVVQKRDPESGQPTIGSVTRRALEALGGAARALDVPTTEEEVPPPGVIDLNRTNLAVLIGPRISALIAQAISADPVIRWSTDRRGQWYITDTATGQEYHSDFDDGWTASAAGERACVAHIGRIRRPDGRGTFLYLAGAHSPGTAGAVALFTRDLSSLWEQVKRSPQWSAVVRTIADDHGKPASTVLASPVYTHGKVT